MRHFFKSKFVDPKVKKINKLHEMFFLKNQMEDPKNPLKRVRTLSNGP